MPVLVNSLSDVERDVRTFAAEDLRLFAFDADKVVPALVKVLGDPELAPRYSAAAALGEFGVEARAAVPELVRYAERAGGW